ncbi:MAG: PQQ-binding-like beta-propeller repeat protein [Verrucomicrobiota bacterium]
MSLIRWNRISLLGLILLGTVAFSTAAENWPGWRGPNNNGKVPDENPPLKWDAATAVLWKSEVAGRGHSSPTIHGDRIYLATGDDEKLSQSVLAYDRKSGKQLWEKTLFSGFEKDKRLHKRNTLATSSVACDGERLLVLLMNNAAVHLTALSLEGEVLWQKKVGDFKSHWGYSASPILYKGLVLVAADHANGGYVSAFEAQTGERVWKQDRPKSPNYPSPVVCRVAGKDQLIITGCKMLAAYNPSTGEPLWSAIDATTEECVGSVVVDGGLAFASGGYPKKETVAVKADGSGEVVWRNEVQVYVPSMLTHEGYLYAITDKGEAYCFEAATGKEMWKERLGGVFNASPVLAGEHIFISSQEGVTFVIKPDPKKLDVVSKNQLGSEVFATPSFAGDRIYLRVAEKVDGKRQEFLYCVGKK